jgi:hypothetical protein
MLTPSMMYYCNSLVYVLAFPSVFVEVNQTFFSLPTYRWVIPKRVAHFWVKTSWPTTKKSSLKYVTDEERMWTVREGESECELFKVWCTFLFFDHPISRCVWKPPNCTRPNVD